MMSIGIPIDLARETTGPTSPIVWFPSQASRMRCIASGWNVASASSSADAASVWFSRAASWMAEASVTSSLLSSLSIRAAWSKTISPILSSAGFFPCVDISLRYFLNASSRLGAL
jgi:hypothetical protein